MAKVARVVRFHEFGGPEVLKLDEVEVRAPLAGEVRISVKALGLNRAECLFREGKISGTSEGFALRSRL